jgi:hypothetical protein
MMAIGFDESDDYYDISDAAELTLQDGDWCVGMWTYVSNNTGSNAQYIASNNGWSASHSFNLCLNEESAGSYSDKWQYGLEDGDGTFNGELATTETGADSTWRLIIIQRDATAGETQMWICEEGASATEDADEADTNLGAINGGDWNIGRRVDGNADRYYGSIACEFFKGDFALSQGQIEALAAGLPVKTLAKQLGYTLDVYLPMYEADATLLDQSGNGNDATRHSAPTTEDHPAICTPVKRRRM